MSRPSNEQLVAEFRHLLLEGAKARFQGLKVDAYAPDLLGLTKEWRADLWRKLNEVEERLCPKPPNSSR